jgi:hypothetical protein
MTHVEEDILKNPKGISLDTQNISQDEKKG